VQKYGRPAFLLVEGGGRTWVGFRPRNSRCGFIRLTLQHQDLLIQIRRHHGAVASRCAIRFSGAARGLLKSAVVRDPQSPPGGERKRDPARRSHFRVVGESRPLSRSALDLRSRHSSCAMSRACASFQGSPAKVMLKRGAFFWPAELPAGAEPLRGLIATPKRPPKRTFVQMGDP